MPLNSVAYEFLHFTVRLETKEMNPVLFCFYFGYGTVGEIDQVP